MKSLMKKEARLKTRVPNNLKVNFLMTPSTLLRLANKTFHLARMYSSLAQSNKSTFQLVLKMIQFMTLITMIPIC